MGVCRRFSLKKDIFPCQYLFTEWKIVLAYGPWCRGGRLLGVYGNFFRNKNK